MRTWCCTGREQGGPFCRLFLSEIDDLMIRTRTRTLALVRVVARRPIAQHPARLRVHLAVVRLSKVARERLSKTFEAGALHSIEMTRELPEVRPSIAAANIRPSITKPHSSIKRLT